MNFDKIKNQMNESVENLPDKEYKIDLTKGQNNPVQMIRKNMRKEILMQLVGIIILLVYPFIRQYELVPLAKSTYLIFMSLSALMIFLYVAKLALFLKKTSNYSVNTKDAIKDYIYEIKLTLESYKAYVISSTLLMPFPILALLRGNLGTNENALTEFEKWFTLDLNVYETIFLICTYIGLSFLFYWITNLWTNKLYGKHVIELENIVKDLGEEE